MSHTHPPPVGLTTPSWETPAFGHPGEKPTWAPSDKDGITCALGGAGRCWATFRRGILTEVFYPRPDRPCLRDLRFVVTDGHGFVADEEIDTEHTVQQPDLEVPLYRLTNTCRRNRFCIDKTILCDPRRSVVILDVRFQPIQSGSDPLRLFVVVNPHLADRGAGNDAWLADYKGRPMLFASRKDPSSGDVALAVACDAPWLTRSVGYLGRSDGLTDLRQNHRLTWAFNRATDGNVVLSAEIDLMKSCEGCFRLALGFDRKDSGAALTSILSLQESPEILEKELIDQWKQWHRDLMPLDRSHPQPRDLYRISATVLRAHRSPQFSGGGVASLSTPWGEARGDDDSGGYHVVWTRDLVEAAGALLAIGAIEDGRRAVQYLSAVQEPDGHWPQEMWLDGATSAPAVQMDETALPILLVDLTHQCRAWGDDTIKRFWPMVKAAALFIYRNGPASAEDRWENEPGYSVNTLATEIAALAVAAVHADANGETELAQLFRATADIWNANLESWTYVKGTALAREVGVDGYYIRLAPEALALGRDPAAPLKTARQHRAIEVVSPDALSLVRYGLRHADDPRILSTIKVIDAQCKVDTPGGPCWHRYTFDQYGEHADGGPSRTEREPGSIGRAWPLLTGERGHHELIAGHTQAAESMLQTMVALAGDWGMIPEQVWDTESIPAKGMFKGRPTGSAMPLAWAHAEYLKLRRSLVDGKCFDCPAAVIQRYANDDHRLAISPWRIDHQPVAIPNHHNLRIELSHASTVAYRITRENKVTDGAVETKPTAGGLHAIDLPTAGPLDGILRFSLTEGESIGPDFVVQLRANAVALPNTPEGDACRPA